MDRLYHVICLLNLLLVVVMLTGLGSETVYIAPQPDETVCPQYPCTSLSQFATNSSNYISNSSDITLYLLPGHHRLDDEITVSNADSFIMTNYLQGEGGVLIECNNPLGRLNVNLTKFVHIKGWLHFLGCEGNKISMVDELLIKEVSFEGVVSSRTTLELSEIPFAVISRSNLNASSYNDSHYLAQFAKDPGDSDHIFLDGFRSTPTGGAIIITFSNVWIESCAFEGNAAQFSATAAIFADKISNISILDSRFLNNEASNFSSVLFLGPDSNLHVSNCTFKDNIAGTAMIISVNGDISINGSTFNHNRAIFSGGAIFAYGSSVHISQSIFNNNSVLYNGGVLYAYQSSIYASGCSFMGNLAHLRGGVLYTHNSSFNFVNNVFSNNMALTEGGVLYTEFENATAAFLHIIFVNCTFSRNFASDYGGVITANSATFFITDSTFIENFATIGGVIVTIAFFHITNSTFSNNTALLSGGVTASYGSFYFIDCMFSKNVAQFVLGGTFAASNGLYYINRCSFKGSRAGEIGGAITANNGSFIILNSNFHGNVAQVNGGDMLVSQCLFLITNCTFNDNNISSLYFFNSNVTFDGYVSFKNNNLVTHNIIHMLGESDNQGGAITSVHSQLYFSGHTTLSVH